MVRQNYSLNRLEKAIEAVRKGEESTAEIGQTFHVPRPT